jgi:hypothetical protein
MFIFLYVNSGNSELCSLWNSYIDSLSGKIPNKHLIINEDFISRIEEFGYSVITVKGDGVCLIGLIIFVFFRIVYIVQWQEFY